MILLTGGGGYLGKHVAQLLNSQGVLSVITNGDLTQFDVVLSLLEQIRPTVIIHCAAVVPKNADAYHDESAANASIQMVKNLRAFTHCQMVFASSLVAADRASSAYANGKWLAEQYLLSRDVLMRLPGLFGLPRRSGVIYEAARSGVIPESFGPYHAMHVQDAAEYMVRAATMPGDGNREPFNVIYGDPRLEACYGSLGVTFDQRVHEFAAEPLT